MLPFNGLDLCKYYRNYTVLYRFWQFFNFYFQGDDSYILVMEHETQMMDLFEATQKMGYFNESDAKSILKQVYQGTTHCLSVGILHRDIKDENVLVNIQTREVNNC